MKPLAPLPIHGTQFKDFPNVKIMHYTVACQIFISESICFLYRCLVMTVKVLIPLSFCIEKGRENTLVLCGSVVATY